MSEQADVPATLTGAPSYRYGLPVLLGALLLVVALSPLDRSWPATAVAVGVIAVAGAWGLARPTHVSKDGILLPRPIRRRRIGWDNVYCILKPDLATGNPHASPLHRPDQRVVVILNSRLPVALWGIPAQKAPQVAAIGGKPLRAVY